MGTEIQNADPDGWVAASKRIKCRMVTKTLIEALERAVEYVESAENRMHPYVQAGNTTAADARAALEDVEVLLATLNAIVEKEELPENWDSDSWTDDNNYDDVHGHGMDAGAWYVAKQIRTALAKFQVKS